MALVNSNIRHEIVVSKKKVVKLPFKKGDEVLILTGDDKGKKGEILKVVRKKDGVIVKGIKLQKKVVTAEDRTKSFKNVEGLVHFSNVMLVGERKKREEVKSKGVSSKKKG